MERASARLYQDNRAYIPGKQANVTSVKTVTKKWRFRPRSIWPFVMWGLALFAGFKITVIPLIEGISNYAMATNEIIQLKNQHSAMQKELNQMLKKRDYMKTPSYVEERAHELGLVKSGESQILLQEKGSTGSSTVE
jgi:hypothetical protein